MYNESRIAPEQKKKKRTFVWRQEPVPARRPSAHTQDSRSRLSPANFLKVCHGSTGMFPPSAADFLIAPDEMCRREELAEDKEKWSSGVCWSNKARGVIAARCGVSGSETDKKKKKGIRATVFLIRLSLASRSRQTVSKEAKRWKQSQWQERTWWSTAVDWKTWMKRPLRQSKALFF